MITLGKRGAVIRRPPCAFRLMRRNKNYSDREWFSGNASAILIIPSSGYRSAAKVQQPSRLSTGPGASPL
ncbi:hypothetical protein AZA_62746 [Nitrospirillum viridazoti Y2]|nr:hypothetical protein AZA_62746 [Nitrospirillum amazonense Y2]